MNHLYLNSIKTFLLILGLFALTKLNGQNMDSHKWNNRIIIVSKSIETSNKYQIQIQNLRSKKEELKDRKIVLYEIDNNKYRFTDFQNSSNNDSWNEISEIDLIKFKNRTDFEISLIGLDGGIKLKSNELVNTKELFDLIDSMPMRKYEMENQKNNK